jgi:hypothetical protein
MHSKSNCQTLHQWARSLERHRFPFDESALPRDGIYFLFEKGEAAHGGARIVRIGTHTGVGQLRSRLRQHFVVENKDRSIFRKNIGRALLLKRGDAYASVWELDMTSAFARRVHGSKVDRLKQKQLERAVTQFLQKDFSFAVVAVPNKAKRLSFESKIISTLSHCTQCGASARWLGNYSPKKKIRQSGLWLINELYKTPLTAKELVYLQGL